MKQALNWWLPCIALVLIVFLQAILFLAIQTVQFELLNDYGDNFDDILTSIYLFAKNCIILVVLMIFLQRSSGRSWAVLRLEKASIPKMAISCVMILSLVPWEVYLTWNESHSHGTIDAQGNYFSPAIAVSWLAIVVLTPLTEELFFRGYVLSVFGKKSAILGVIASCVLFAIYEYQGVSAALFSVVLFSCSTAYCTLMTGSVYPAIMAHALWNLLASFNDAGYFLLNPTIEILIISAVTFTASLAILQHSNKKRANGKSWQFL